MSDDLKKVFVCKCGSKVEDYVSNNRVYCSRECVGRFVKVKPTTKILKNCKSCNKEFLTYKWKTFCSRNCMYKWMGDNFEGYWKGKKRDKKTIEKIRKANLGKKLSKEHKEKIKNKLKGKLPKNWHPNIGFKNKEENINWLGGISFEPYGLEFNNKLKERIRQRDNYRCQECKYTQKQLKSKLFVHHIDYNKQNNSQNNLISLCNSCHSQTNFNRLDWEKYYEVIISEKK